MKAPDKIYFEIDEKGKVHTYFGLQPENATEYIRKDTLMEWAKENRDSLGRLSYGEFVDKLNKI